MNSTPSNLGKSLSAPVSVSHSPAPSTPTASSSFEANRRPSPAGNSAAYAAARKSQAARKQHRDQRRPGQGRVDDDDAMAELRAVRNPSSRRGQTSITHLMNYSLPPPRSYLDHHQQHNRSYRRNTTWGLGSGHHAIDKARYVHANYRFVVNPAGTYTAHAVHADEHLDWPDVLQVIASTESQATSCPICLSEPVAPRMAKCGHIFCLPCLLRFMNSNDEVKPGHERRAKWKKCPICEDSIYLSDMRPVRFYAGQESPLPQPGADVVLRLMMRNAGSTLALPNEGGADVLQTSHDIPWHFAANVLDYARIMKGTGTYMTAEYEREIEDLLKQEKEDEMMFHEGDEWTQKAIKGVNAAMDKVKDMGGVELALTQPTPKDAASSTAKSVEHDFYFYSSPPHLYLSPLDIRILKTKFGSFSLFPSTLLPRVEHISTGHVVDDALRKRAKYLGHLPYGCVVSFLECDWTDIVPAETLETFADEIERRRKRNRDKAAQEERERLQAERIEAAAIRGARRMVGSASIDDEVTIRYSSEPAPERAVDPSEFIPLGASSTTPPNPRPGFSQLAELSTSPSTSRTVWGTPAIPTSPEVLPHLPPADVDDGWLKDDALLDPVSAADIALQMEALGVEAPSPNPAAASGGGGGAKKKKKQKITLMSTGGRRGL